MSETKGHDILFGTMEKIVQTMASAEQSYYKCDNCEFVTALGSIRSLSNRVGFLKQAGVAADAQLVLEYEDRIALSAIVLRLFRVGDQSLQAIWEIDFYQR
jgi:hypothetical protein